MGRSETDSRDLHHHEELYAGFAQSHFARPAVRAFRYHLADRILTSWGIARPGRVLSLGCGIGDTELLLAPSVGHILGIDLSAAAVRQANEDAARLGIHNAEFEQSELTPDAFPPDTFDAVAVVFFLHHLTDSEIESLAAELFRIMKPGGALYALDPNRYRLSGAVGRILVPNLMRRYQSPDERQLVPRAVRRQFAAVGFEARTRMYDYLSTPLAGLLPGARRAYRLARWADEVLVRAPGVNFFASNFELLARKLAPGLR